jgi:hypothetical protein
MIKVSMRDAAMLRGYRALARRLSCWAERILDVV